MIKEFCLFANLPCRFAMQGCFPDDRTLKQAWWTAQGGARGVEPPGWGKGCGQGYELMLVSVHSSVPDTVIIKWPGCLGALSLLLLHLDAMTAR